MKPRTFRAFVAEQVGRCEALAPLPNYLLTESAMREICDWLESASGEPFDRAKQSDLQWLQESVAARKVKAVIDDIMQGEVQPTIVQVRFTWERLNPKQAAAANYDCPECEGTGWKIVRKGGAEGAVRCPAGCPVPKPVFAPDGARRVPDEAVQREWVRAVGADLAAKLAKTAEALPPMPSKPITAEDFRRSKK